MSSMNKLLSSSSSLLEGGPNPPSNEAQPQQQLRLSSSNRHQDDSTTRTSKIINNSSSILLFDPSASIELLQLNLDRLLRLQQERAQFTSSQFNHVNKVDAKVQNLLQTFRNMKSHQNSDASSSSTTNAKTVIPSYRDYLQRQLEMIKSNDEAFEIVVVSSYDDHEHSNNNVAVNEMLNKEEDETETVVVNGKKMNNSKNINIINENNNNNNNNNSRSKSASKGFLRSKSSMMSNSIVSIIDLQNLHQFDLMNKTGSSLVDFVVAATNDNNNISSSSLLVLSEVQADILRKLRISQFSDLETVFDHSDNFTNHNNKSNNDDDNNGNPDDDSSSLCPFRLLFETALAGIVASFSASSSTTTLSLLPPLKASKFSSHSASICAKSFRIFHEGFCLLNFANRSSQHHHLTTRDFQLALEILKLLLKAKDDEKSILRENYLAIFEQDNLPCAVLDQLISFLVDTVGTGRQQ